MSVQCDLCPKQCVIAHGQSGECRIRVNINERLRAVTYGYPCSVHVDPVEKKPVFHFLPGTTTFSLATVGCNLHCKNCQNWEISQQNPEEVDGSELPPDRIPELAVREGCRSVSYTYTDPVVYYEYTRDACIRSRAAGLKNILVTAAYINPEPWKKLLAHVDAVRIDLKSMSDEFYRQICDASLQPVLNAIVIAKSMGVELELVHLVIPTLNDSDESLAALCRWIRQHVGRETPLHFSRFFPQFRMRNLPPTPLPTLQRARQIAEDIGLDYVYIGNITESRGGVTACPKCKRVLIRRSGYSILENTLRNGRCPACGKEIYGVWK